MKKLHDDDDVKKLHFGYYFSKIILKDPFLVIFYILLHLYLYFPYKIFLVGYVFFCIIIFHQNIYVSSWIEWVKEKTKLNTFLPNTVFLFFLLGLYFSQFTLVPPIFSKILITFGCLLFFDWIIG